MMEKWRKMGNTKYNGEKIPEKLVGWVEAGNPTHFGSTELSYFFVVWVEARSPGVRVEQNPTTIKIVF
jgi:hypothetical protein